MHATTSWRRGRRVLALVLVSAPTVTGCASARTGTEQLNAVLWMQGSVEYTATTRQAFQAAGARLPEALADSGWTAALEQRPPYGQLAPAVILDVDETALDNTPFQARLVRDGREYDQASWSTWVSEESAAAVPGALEFARRADALGVRVFYVTNRDHPDEPATRRNLEAVGFPLDTTVDAVLTRGERPGWGSDKSSRRAFVATTHRVLLLVGDDLNDFVAGARQGPEERRALAARHEEAWGRRWIMLPNPAYGSWERALYGFDGTLSTGERWRRKADSLDIRP